MPNSDIYIIGGEENSSSLDTSEKLTKTGFELIQMNMKISRHCAMPIEDTTIIIIGGIINERPFSNKTFLFDTLTNTFTTGPDLMKGRQLHSCARIDGDKLIIAGGKDLRGGLDSVEILDCKKGHWNEGPILPQAIFSASMVEHPDGGVVLIGGQSGPTILNTLYYLPRLDADWVMMSQQLKTPRRFHSSLMIPNSITNCHKGIFSIVALSKTLHPKLALFTF